MARGGGERDDRRAEPGPGAQDHDLVGVAPPADVHRRHVGEPGDDQVAALPPHVLHLHERVQVPPVGPVDAARDLQVTIGAERKVGAQPAPPPDHRDGGHLLVELPGEVAEQLAAQPLAGQVVGELVGGGQGAQHTRVDLVEVGVHQVEVLGQVIVADPVQVAHVQPEVVDQCLALVLAQRPGRGVLAEKGVDGEQGGDPVAQVLDVGPVLGDGQLARLAFPPVVDVVGDHVHGLGQDMRPGHELQILPDHLLGVRQPVRVPERSAEQLVPDRDVVEQFRRLRHMGADPPALDRPGVQRRGVHALGADPVHRAGHEVRARAFQRVQQHLVGMGGQHVVGVHEREEFSPGPLNAPVAGAARSPALAADQREPGVGGHPALGDLRPGVGGAVVHHDHFKVGERLRGDRFQAVVQILAVVEERHHDTDAWGAGHLAAPCARSQPSATGSKARST